jgi:hypothetical protein
VKRRTFIGLLGLAVGLVVSSLLPVRLLNRIPGCEAWLDGRMSRALSDLIGPDATPVPPTQDLGWTRSRALRQLVGTQSPFELAPILSDGSELSALLAMQQQEDFQTGRVAVLGGWVLSETEISVAVLLGNRAGQR